MAKLGTIKFDTAQVMARAEFTVNVTMHTRGVTRWRIWLAERLFRFAAWLMYSNASINKIDDSR